MNNLLLIFLTVSSIVCKTKYLIGWISQPEEVRNWSVGPVWWLLIIKMDSLSTLVLTFLLNLRFNPAIPISRIITEVCRVSKSSVSDIAFPNPCKLPCHAPLHQSICWHELASPWSAFVSVVLNPTSLIGLRWAAGNLKKQWNVCRSRWDRGGYDQFLAVDSTNHSIGSEFLCLFSSECIKLYRIQINWISAGFKDIIFKKTGRIEEC